MSEQQAPPPEDTPTPDTQAPEQTQEVNWQERYENLHPEYTRATQELSQYKTPEHREQLAREWLTENGYQLQDEPEPEYLDPVEQRIAQFEQFRRATEEQLAQQNEYFEQLQQQQKLEALEEHVEGELDKIGGLTQPQRDWIVTRAVALPNGPDGRIDLPRAYQDFLSFLNEEKKAWAQTKRAPHFPASGQAGTGTPNKQDMNLDQITDWAVQEYAARTQE